MEIHESRLLEIALFISGLTQEERERYLEYSFPIQTLEGFEKLNIILKRNTGYQ